MANTPERAAYLAMQRALRAIVNVEGLEPNGAADQLAKVMDGWVKKYPGSDGKKGGDSK